MEQSWFCFFEFKKIFYLKMPFASIRRDGIKYDFSFESHGSKLLGRRYALFRQKCGGGVSKSLKACLFRLVAKSRYFFRKTGLKFVCMSAGGRWYGKLVIRLESWWKDSAFSSGIGNVLSTWRGKESGTRPWGLQRRDKAPRDSFSWKVEC